ncbi:MAG: hypothetical protein QT08_C0020G0028 [archaeon GW2011_AR17]|nr:MAG: hypothetical protein QT08_C0020G0028 [archaeon GW2011_AR17]MBS3154051.1 hypothetical protein [Candidatus Woesearchaeota archaeon]HIH15559.1 hypothetical protein [Nanoarchaeota archaeon]HIH59109.1 hypothetical protein [Nanoarchaeota archaeon]HII14603.1 hypothetical protein [Nanoarchaeota archaeon]
MKRKIGLDISGVIINIDEASITPGIYQDLFCTEEKKYRTIPPMDGAFAGLSRLSLVFEREIYLISHAAPRHIETVTRDWLDYHGFSETTGINPDHFYFCDTRQGKKGLCDRLGITDMVDDRLEILSYLPGLQRYLFQGRDEEIQTYAAYLSQVHRVHNWRELVQKIEEEK